MKKLIVVAVALLFLIVPAFVFASSCDSGSDYYIKVAFEGEEYTLGFGHPDSGSDVPYGALVIYVPQVTSLAIAPEYITFFGEIADENALEDPVSFYIEVEADLFPPILGTYTGNFDLYLSEDGWIRIFIIQDGTPYYYYSISGTVNISSFGDVGEAIEGTFDVTLNEGGDLIFTIGDPSLYVEGSFRVKRIAEEDLPPSVFN
jgi:hypothetical protein